MDDARRLRIRISLLLAASGALGALPLAACGAKVVVDTGTNGGTGGTGGTGGSTGTGAGAAPPTCEFGSPTQQCFSPPPDGTAPADCPDPSTVEDGCCNPATSGPFEQDGSCCYWFCEGACCGRPFTVEGRARVAGVTERDGWSVAPLDPEPAELHEGARAALVDAWLADAQMEHASIASFARFTLELLALGAPAELVAASQRASLDEVEHARLCFTIASRLGGRSFGPMALDLTGAQRGGSLAESAAWAVREGCIGETIAALTARAQLERAEDEGVRRALDRIAEDEEGHAALAWRFVAWALATGGEEVRVEVARAFEAGAVRLRSQCAGGADPIDHASWHRFGRLTPAEADGATLAALREVIAPCAALLLPPPSSAPQPREITLGV